MSRLLTLPEVAEILRITRRTLERYIRAGDIPAVKYARKVFIEEREVEKFIKRSRAS